MKKSQEKPKILVVGQPGINPLDVVKMVERKPEKLVLIDPRENRGSFRGVACGGKK
jgi:hypothetical protein